MRNPWAESFPGDRRWRAVTTRDIRHGGASSVPQGWRANGQTHSRSSSGIDSPPASDPSISRRNARRFASPRPKRPLYHVAPRYCRASIQQHELDSSRDAIPGLMGTYLWQTIEHPRAYAAPLGDDIWIVECSGIPLDFGGPWSIHPGERWTPDPIPPNRVAGPVTEPTFGSAPPLARARGSRRLRPMSALRARTTQEARAQETTIWANEHGVETSEAPEPNPVSVGRYGRIARRPTQQDHSWRGADA